MLSRWGETNSLDLPWSDVSLPKKGSLKDKIETWLAHGTRQRCYQNTDWALVGTIQDVIDLAFVLVKGKQKNAKLPDYKCAVKKAQIQW